LTRSTTLDVALSSVVGAQSTVIGALLRQQRLKPATGATRAGVVAADLLYELLIAVNDTVTELYGRFRRIGASLT
jgi:hypothetical protein